MKSSVLYWILLAVLALTSLKVYSQNMGIPFMIKEVMLESKVLDEERKISIYLPKGYNNSEENFAVLYLLDGEVYFHLVSTAVEYLSTRKEIPPMIVVAIHNVDRIRDFAPIAVEGYPNSGGGDKFVNFISNELVSHINENFRTAGFNVLVGSSGGGAFATYYFSQKPENFDGYLVISPYLQWHDNYLVDIAKKNLKNNYGKEKYFYMTVGNEPEYFPSLDSFSNLIKESSAKGLMFKYEQFQSENHGTMPYLGVYFGLKYIFSNTSDFN